VNVIVAFLSWQSAGNGVPLPARAFRYH